MGSEFSNSLSITKIDTTVVDSNINVNSKVKDEVEKTVKKVDTVNDNIRNSNKILETKRGVFAGIVNSVDSGSLYLTLLKSLRSIIGSSNISVFISIIISVILFSLFWFFIANTYKVISRRMFLEGRVYKKVPLKKFVFLLRVKKWWNASKVMFITFVYEFLWSLTIIGAFQENDYERNKVNEIKLKYILDEANGNVYPERLYIIPERQKRKRVEVVNYLRHYNISSLILMFFIFSFIGWLWEVSFLILYL